MKVCILVIATNKYIAYVDQLMVSIRSNFLVNHEISLLLFTNHNIKSTSQSIRVSYIGHEPWPMPTLRRYHYFLKESEYISQFDYCYYIDADMRVVSQVGEEIFGDLVAVQHPGFWNRQPEFFTYERRRESTAAVSLGSGVMYYAGGFNGGKSEQFLKMSEALASNIDVDLRNNIIAIWHDESHLNRYLVDFPPAIELSPSYCFPEAAFYKPEQWNVPFTPRILALDKNHAAVRS